MKHYILIASVLSVLITACGSSNPEPKGHGAMAPEFAKKQEPETIAQPRPNTKAQTYGLAWEGEVAGSEEWSEWVIEALKAHGENLLTGEAKDSKRYCKRFNELNSEQRVEFWAQLISQMAKHESNFDYQLVYKEGFKDSKGRYISSLGLMQISLESSQGYKCGAKVNEDLLNPKLNLECSVRILNHWFGKDKRIGSRIGTDWRGGARYWAVLRETNKGPYARITKATRSLSLCE